jgi:hypothetical protein
MGSGFSGGFGGLGIFGYVSGPRIPHPKRDIATQISQVLDTIKSIYIKIKK